jgi:hypothetical protein
MNIFDLIGNFVVAAVNAATRIVTELVAIVNELLDTSKKKVLVKLSEQQKNSQKSSSAKSLQKPQTSQRQIVNTIPSKSSSIYTPKNPIPGQDLLLKEGWTKVNVHPVPETGQQVILLKNQKNNTAKMLGKEAFLKYLEELNEKHNR